MAEEVISSMREFRSRFFPDSFLKNLESFVCEELGLTEPYQHELIKSEGDKKIGTLNFAKPDFSIRVIDAVIGIFYLREGFETEQKDNRIKVRKQDEEYDIIIFDRGDSYSVNITNPIKLLSRVL